MSLASFIQTGAQTISNGFINYGPVIYNGGTLLLAAGAGASVIFLGGIITNDSDTKLGKLARFVGALCLGVLTSTATLMITHPFTPVNMLFTKSIAPVVMGSAALTVIALPLLFFGACCTVMSLIANPPNIHKSLTNAALFEK